MRSRSTLILAYAALLFTLTGASSLAQQTPIWQANKNGRVQGTHQRTTVVAIAKNTSECGSKQPRIAQLMEQQNTAMSIDSALKHLDDQDRDGFLRLQRSVRALSRPFKNVLPKLDYSFLKELGNSKNSSVIPESYLSKPFGYGQHSGPGQQSAPTSNFRPRHRRN